MLTLLLCLCYDTYHLLTMFRPYCHVKPLTHLVLANRCLAMLPLCSAPLIALLVAGEDWSYEDQTNVNLENFAGKMTIPSKSLLSLLARCSRYCYAYAMIPITCLSCLQNCHVKPLTHHDLANRWLAMLPLLLSPSYSVVSCRWRLELIPCWNMDILLGYHNSSYLINASIYLVKGGRLGLLLGVLFHSCRLSSCHTGVMRWPYPRNHFYLCLLDARAIAMPMLWYLSLAYHASKIAMSNL